LVLYGATWSREKRQHAKHYDLLLSAAKVWNKAELFSDLMRVAPDVFAESESRSAVAVLYSGERPVRETKRSLVLELTPRAAEESVRDPEFRLRIEVGEEGVSVVTDHMSSVPALAVLGEVSGLFPFLGSQNEVVFQRLPPSTRATITSEGLRLTTEHGRSEGDEATTDGLLQALEESFSRNVGKRCAVAFSGGIDSSVLLQLALTSGRKVLAVTVGMPGSHDVEFSKRVAQSMGADRVVCELSDAEVLSWSTYLRRTLRLSNPMDVSLGVIFHVTALESARNGFRQLLAGQGADELFGGYMRHLRAYRSGGPEEAAKVMSEDLEGLWRWGIVRDFCSAGLAGCYLTLPYLSNKVVSVALSIPPDRKLDGQRRKLVLREVARKLGLPDEVVEGEKKAAQYGSRIEKVVRRALKGRSGCPDDGLSRRCVL
jgi:asparagine synthetase B (glutamine-hydrolysing)